MISQRIFNIWLALGLLLNLLQFSNAKGVLGSWVGPSWLWLIVVPLSCLGLLQMAHWANVLWQTRARMTKTVFRALLGYGQNHPQAVRVRRASV
jgi:hypothetical protein